MDGDERSVSISTVAGIGFILLGILYMFAKHFHHRTSINTSSRIPGILFIGIGLIILVVQGVRKMRE